MRLWPIVAIDPGGAETGVVVRDRDQCLWFTVVTRDGMPMADYLAEVVRVVGDPVADLASTDGEYPLVAVEGLVEPNAHMGVTSVRGLLDTAKVLGAVLAHWPEAIEVRPGGHGSGSIATYPACLRPTRGQGRGHDRLRHCRSAFDVAHAAVQTLRLEQRGGLR